MKCANAGKRQLCPRQTPLPMREHAFGSLAAASKRIEIVMFGRNSTAC